MDTRCTGETCPVDTFLTCCKDAQQQELLSRSKSPLELERLQNDMHAGPNEESAWHTIGGNGTDVTRAKLLALAAFAAVATLHVVGVAESDDTL